jgi:hypothetical protein
VRRELRSAVCAVILGQGGGGGSSSGTAGAGGGKEQAAMPSGVDVRALSSVEKLAAPQAASSSSSAAAAAAAASESERRGRVQRQTRQAGVRLGDRASPRTRRDRTRSTSALPPCVAAYLSLRHLAAVTVVNGGVSTGMGLKGSVDITTSMGLRGDPRTARRSDGSSAVNTLIDTSAEDAAAESAPLALGASSSRGLAASSSAKPSKAALARAKELLRPLRRLALAAALVEGFAPAEVWRPLRPFRFPF